MLLTVPILNKGSFLGSLINKCRQVVRIKPVKKLESNVTPNISTSITPATPIPTSSKTFADTPPASAFTPEHQTNRPANVANLSLSSRSNATKSLEEKAGLPPRPKKPLSPYFRYMVEQRSKLQATNPKLGLIEMIKQISKQWTTVDASVKERLQAEYKKDQEKYIEIRTKYDSKITDEQRSQLKELKQEQAGAKAKRMMRKHIKQLGRPKKPASAFLRFIIKERILSPQTSKETYREWHQKTTAKWSSLSDEQKSVFLTEARKELDQYKKDLSVWEEKMIRLGHVDVIRQSNLIDPPEPKSKK